MGENQKWSVCAWPDLVVVWVGGLGVWEVVLLLLLYFLSVGLFPRALFFRGAFWADFFHFGVASDSYLCCCLDSFYLWGSAFFTAHNSFAQPYNIAEFL